MGNISDKLQYLAETKEAIKEAIKAKGVAIDDNTPFRKYANAINNIDPDTDNDVVFYDYYGKAVYSYTKEEFLSLTELPPVPHLDLYAAKWNNSLSDAQASLEEQGFVDIGECCDSGNYPYTPSGLLLHIEVSDELSKTIRFNFMTFTRKGEIDWGDGNIETYDYEGFSSTLYRVEHTYADYGQYTIRIKSGNVKIGTYADYAIKNIFGYAFTSNNSNFEITNCMRLQSIICTNATALKVSNCPSLVHIMAYSTFEFPRISNCPSLRTVIDRHVQARPNCSSIRRLNAVPAENTGDLNAFTGYTSLQRVIIQRSAFDDAAFRDCHSLTSIQTTEPLRVGRNAFENCYSLESVSIFNDYTTYITAECFLNCVSLRQITTTTLLTGIKERAFKGCASLKVLPALDNCSSIEEGAFEASGIERFSVPSKVKKLPVRLFAESALRTIEMHNEVTEIGSQAFYHTLLESFVLPNSVSIIGAEAFSSCSLLSVFDCRASSVVPSVGENALPSDCKIIVPDSLYDEWIAAENWSTYASQIVKASEYNG